jgi:flagellar hook-basal body complex protein FliE
MAISGIGGIFGAIGLDPMTQANATSAANAPAPTDGNGNTFTNALDALQASTNNSDALAQAAATGNLTDIHNYTIAASETQLMTDLTVAVRDRAVEAFNEIMRMQV